MFLEIIVEIPKKFTPEQRALLEKLLPDDDDITDITGNIFINHLSDSGSLDNVMEETIEMHPLKPFKKLGLDKIDNTRDDQDQVTDGIEKRAAADWMFAA